jgi:hypothetical protein
MKPPLSAVPPSETAAPFALFDGDWLNRFFRAIRLGGSGRLTLTWRCLFVVGITWVPMAILAILGGYYSARIEAINFFADYAAYMQFLIALPIFIVAERVVARHTREASADFLNSGVVGPADRDAVNAIHRDVGRLSRSRQYERICILLAYGLAFMTIAPELLRWQPQMVTWHTRQTVSGTVVPTAPGVWAVLVALPILNYCWLRFAWKILVWTRYLYRMSRLRLTLVATHPDLTGGIGFISEVQSKFALVLFAYGISNVAAVIAYKITLERASLLAPPVWGPALGFIVGAPLLFTVPLFFFTDQLLRVKQRAKALWRERAFRQSLQFEAAWLEADVDEQTRMKAAEVTGLNQVATAFGRVENMRVVPFDIRSGVHLLASTAGSVATALPLLKVQGPLKEWLDLLQTLLRQGG